MITKQTVAVTTAATLLSTASSVKSIAVSNTSAYTIYLGESTVTSSSGMAVLAGETYAFELRVGQSLYAICTQSINVVVLDVEEPGIAPSPVKVDLSALAGATGATVATTVAGLGAGTDGKLGMIRVGTYPDAEYVELVYDLTNTRWVSKAQPLVYNSDLSYMGTNTTAYTYLQTDSVGAVSSGIGVAVKPVRHATELLAAGLTLQGCLTAIMKGSSQPATFTVQAKFFQNDTGDTVTFSSDGSTAVGECLSPLVSASGTGIVYEATGWANVVQAGSSSALTSVQVTKANLWPRLYGKVGSGSAYGSVIDVDLQVRWVG